MNQTKRLLVVDDESYLRSLLRDLLQPAYQVSMADGAVEALTLVDCERYDLMMIDMVMPGLSGLELCERVRAHPLRSATPIIILTALDELGISASCRAAGANDFISKPFNPSDLIERVGRLIDA